MSDDAIRRMIGELERDILKLSRAKQALLALLTPDGSSPAVTDAKPADDLTARPEPRGLGGMRHQDAIIEVLRDRGNQPTMPAKIREMLVARGHAITGNVCRSTLQFGRQKGLFRRVEDGWVLTSKALEISGSLI